MSARRHTRIFLRNLFRPASRSPRQIIAQMKGDGFDTVLEKYGHITEPSDGWPKYLLLEQWVPTNLQRVRDLDLDHLGPKRILDLGCGAGYFLYINKLLGHTALGLDLDEVPMFRDSVEALRVPRVIARIEPFTPLPPLGEPFDMITAYLVCFNNHKSDSVWGPAEWDYFLDDCLTRLSPIGRLQLELNRELDGQPYTPALRTFFEKRGGLIDGFRVCFTRDDLAQSASAPAASQNPARADEIPRPPSQVPAR